MALILYGSNLSPFVRKVRVLLIEKGVDYTLDQINELRGVLDEGSKGKRYSPRRGLY